MQPEVYRVPDVVGFAMVAAFDLLFWWCLYRARRVAIRTDWPSPGPRCGVECHAVGVPAVVLAGCRCMLVRMPETSLDLVHVPRPSASLPTRSVLRLVGRIVWRLAPIMLMWISGYFYGKTTQLRHDGPIFQRYAEQFQNLGEQFRTLSRAVNASPCVTRQPL